ncbi:MAG: Cof-type HAD-IIB family hydrolase [Bacillota bacterium]
MRYRLIATDIDGTLLNDEGQVTGRARAALAELERRGATVVLTTARPPRRIGELYRELGLTGPVIAYNGGLAYEPLTGRTLFAHTMEVQIALQVVAAMRAVAPGASLGMELEDHWHVDQFSPRFQELKEQGLLTDMPFFGPLEEALSTTTRGVNKLYFYPAPGLRALFEQRLEEAGISSQVYVTSSNSASNFTEILPGGVNKGAALRALAAILGIPREATLYLGDEEADMPALQEAGLGIAMGNAPDRVKQAARVVTGPNTADGWADAIEEHVLAG